MWNYFFLDAATNLKEREIFLIEPVSALLKLMRNLKHLSCSYFHKVVERRFYILKKFKKLQNIHELNRTSK